MVVILIGVRFVVVWILELCLEVLMMMWVCMLIVLLGLVFVMLMICLFFLVIFVICVDWSRWNLGCWFVVFVSRLRKFYCGMNVIICFVVGRCEKLVSVSLVLC